MVAYAEHYDRNSFECLDEHLTQYLRGGWAAKDLSSGQAAVFLMIDNMDRVWGYYTLSSASADRRLCFTNSQSKQFSYPQVAVTLLGRVAVHRALKGQELGTELIVHALRRAAQAAETVGSYAVILDAKNEKVAELYRRLGFMAFKDQPLKMFLPLDTIKRLPE